MRHGRIRRDLHALVDGELPAGRRADVEAHLRECAPCRGEAERLDALLRRAGELPRSLEPQRELWPRIAARLAEPGGLSAAEAGAKSAGTGARSAGTGARSAAAGARSMGAGARRVPLGERTLRSARPWLAAAAVALVLLSSATTALFVARPGAPERSPADRGPAGTEAALASASMEGWPGVEGGYLRAASELRSTLEAVSDRLDPGTLAAVERNLRIIDAAILESREALATDPENREKLRMLASMYERKLDVLRHVTSVRTGT